jgi:hypothetical protein
LRLAKQRGSILVAAFNRENGFLGHRARLGFDQAIALTAPRVFANFFLSGSCISQFEFLRFTIPIRNQI